MSQATATLYEGLFLLSQGASSDLPQCLDHVRQVLENRGAKIVALRKWDDRKLAYPIKGQRRGVYLLGHFEVAAEALTQIDRDLNLSEIVLRNMILRADHIGEAELELVTREASERSVEADLHSDGDAAPAASPAAAGEGGDDAGAETTSSEDQSQAGDDSDSVVQTVGGDDSDAVDDQPSA